jgi:NADH dehydrogenase
MARPRVVIIGAGFGGLEAVKGLERAPVDITLLDRANHHTFQPLLYQVATAALAESDVAWPIRHLLRRQRNATVLMAEVSGIDLEHRVVSTRALRLPYDFLMVATGATHAYFGRDDWARFAPGLKTLGDAARIRDRILYAFEAAELAASPEEQARLLTFVVIGGGPTGVEMAGAIAEIARQTLTRDFRRINPRLARILLVEAGPRVLSTLAPRLSDYAERALRRAGVEVLTGTRVTDIGPEGVALNNQPPFRAGALIWAAGVRASSVAAWLDAPHDRAGRVMVNPDLSLPGRPEVFVIGDAAVVQQPNGDPVPGVASAAKQMGRYVARRIAAIAGRGADPGPFRYRDEGSLATIGRRAAVVQLGHLQLTGFIGWLFWSVVHIYFLIGLRNRFLVAFNWFWQYVTFQRGARLIVTDDKALVREMARKEVASG